MLEICYSTSLMHEVLYFANVGGELGLKDLECYNSVQRQLLCLENLYGAALAGFS